MRMLLIFKFINQPIFLFEVIGFHCPQGRQHTYNGEFHVFVLNMTNEAY